MTELDTRDDDWVREAFDRARTDAPEPHWIPDAAGAARLSSRHRYRARAAGVLATAAVVGVSTTAYASLSGGVSRGGQQASAAGTSHKAVLTRSELAEYLGPSILETSSGAATLTIAAPQATLTTFGTVLRGIDPSLAHVRYPKGSFSLNTGKEVSDTRDITQIGLEGFWTTDGDASSMNGAHTPDRSRPIGHVNITMLSSHTVQLHDKKLGSCGLLSDMYVSSEFQLAAGNAWSSCLQQPQSDGSVIATTHSEGLSAGEVSIAAREFPDGSAVMVHASSFFAYALPQHPGAALKPVPWTDGTLAAALSGPDVKGLS